MDQTTEQNITRSNGFFNRAAIKRQALKVSLKTRGGKFSRVSEDFINQVEAEAEAQLRRMAAEVFNCPLGQVEPEGETFLTGAGKDRLAEQFNIWIAREVQRQVNKVRTGKTL